MSGNMMFVVFLLLIFAQAISVVQCDANGTCHSAQLKWRWRGSEPDKYQGAQL